MGAGFQNDVFFHSAVLAARQHRQVAPATQRDGIRGLYPPLFQDIPPKIAKQIVLQNAADYQ
jgi:hypothetical protein